MRKREAEALKRKQQRARLDYNNSFNKEHYKQVNFRLSYDKEADIIDFLQNVDSNKDLFVTLIRKEIKRINRKSRKQEKAPDVHYFAYEESE